MKFLGLLLLQTEKAIHSVPLSRVTGVQMPMHPYPDLRIVDTDTEEDQSLITILDKKVFLEFILKNRLFLQCFTDKNDARASHSIKNYSLYITSKKIIESLFVQKIAKY